MGREREICKILKKEMWLQIEKKFKRIKGIIPITLWNQYNNLEEIYDFLEKHKLSKLTQEEKNENTILL